MNHQDGPAVPERINQLFQHLGIQQAHIAARSSEWPGLAAAFPDLFTSLTLVCPYLPNPEMVSPLADRLLIFADAEGDYGHQIRSAVTALPGSILVPLEKYSAWSDLVAENSEIVKEAMLAFLARTTSSGPMETSHLKDGDFGEVSGIHYQIQGSGPPLVLFPMGLVPSQWDPIIPALSRNYCTIRLGGDKLGIVALLEERCKASGYLNMVRDAIDEMNIRPGESVLEIGCGTGAILRWLADYTNGDNAITGVDINGFMLREAGILANRFGLHELIGFQSENAEALSFPDNSFDVLLAVTVMEEVNADKMLAEMVRVTKPGGRIAVIVRAVDRPFFINLPLSPKLRTKVEEPAGWAPGVGQLGCADATLYRRFHEAGLTNIKMSLKMPTFDRPSTGAWLQESVQPILSQEETAEWQAAWVQAQEEGTFFFAYPHHCAVGTKT